MLIAEGGQSKHYLNQPGGGELRSSPKQHLIGKSKKGSKVKVAAHHGHHRSEPHSGGISARSNNQGYNQKTFYSNYIGANSLKGSGNVPNS